jgi:ABC-2 type transport system ATP-binding protein
VDEQDVRQLAATHLTPWRVRATDPDALLAALHQRGAVVAGTTGAGTELPPMTEEQAADLLVSLIADGVRVIAYGPVGSHLETAYLAMTQERR